MKAYTDLEQSKKLAEILPLESADMRYTPFGDTHPWVWEGEVKLLEKDSVPCWSLSALLGLIPNSINWGYYNDSTFVLKKIENGNYIADYYEVYFVKDNPIDATFEMVCWLLENGKI